MADTAPPTAVILTALSVEYDAVRAHLTDAETLVHPSGTRVEHGRLPGTPWYVALAEIGEGTLTAAALTERVNSWLAPQVLFFVGVAGGLKDDIPPPQPAGKRGRKPKRGAELKFTEGRCGDTSWNTNIYSIDVIYRDEREERHYVTITAEDLGLVEGNPSFESFTTPSSRIGRPPVSQGRRDGLKALTSSMRPDSSGPNQWTNEVPTSVKDVNSPGVPIHSANPDDWEAVATVNNCAPIAYGTLHWYGGADWRGPEDGYS